MAKKDKGKSGKAKRKKIAGMKVPKNLALSGRFACGPDHLACRTRTRRRRPDRGRGGACGEPQPAEGRTESGCERLRCRERRCRCRARCRRLAETATGAVAEVVGGCGRRILPSSVAGEEPQARKGDFDHLAENGGKRKRKERAAQRREHYPPHALASAATGRLALRNPPRRTVHPCSGNPVAPLPPRARHPSETGQPCG